MKNSRVTFILRRFMNSIRECVQLKMMEYSRVYRWPRYKYRMQTCTVSPSGLLTSTTQNYLSFLYVTPSQDIRKHTQAVLWPKRPKQTPQFAEITHSAGEDIGSNKEKGFREYSLHGYTSMRYRLIP
jgi:hypothetical protein